MCCNEEIKDYNGNFTYVAYATSESGDNFSLIKKDVDFNRDYMAIYTSKIELDDTSSEFKSFFNGRYFPHGDYTKWSPRNVETISDLRKIRGYEGQKIVLMGYYKAGDKPNLTYEWKNETAEDNGGSVITSNLIKGHWKIQELNSVDIRHYGAKPETGFDNSEIIQKCINLHSETVIPTGIYEVSKTVKLIQRSKSLRGETKLNREVSSAQIPIIKYIGEYNNKISVIQVGRNEVGAEPSIDSSNLNLSNLFIDCNYKSGFGVYSTYLTNDSNISNITITKSNEYNFFVCRAWYANITNIISLECRNNGIALGMPLVFSDGEYVKFNTPNPLELNGCKLDNFRSINSGNLFKESNSPLNLFETDNHKRGYGVGIGIGNAMYPTNITSERSGGVGLYIYSGAQPVKKIKRVYLENNNMGMPESDKVNIFIENLNEGNPMFLDDVFCSLYSGGVLHKGLRRQVWLRNVYSPIFIKSLDFKKNQYEVMTFILKDKVDYRCGYINFNERLSNSELGYGLVNTRESFTINVTPNVGYALILGKTKGKPPIGSLKITYQDGTTTTYSFPSWLNDETFEVIRHDAKKIIKIEKAGVTDNFESMIEIRILDMPITF